ncbi:phosphoribosylaminoimidazolesuccinocarboxamide synthase [Desulfovibrio litoralis]|uniref:Phosphoribosylaminoimidazole-succinocarboxamide synthase n=1 Tax=Desulfovibrio litoralis DSM 11393 TaxID=1121455 RepID=A0A1M7SPE8_9BACT|nr:phosphoribosylaminoimidazolesuccinocarboxamide synthase [Desulfovibrio litoralis]SHN60286.1 phosphoribosylaminoimidazole-succinocarboxamide synthase [Desulfovibrio litoralis DSM 11393]
MKVVTETQIKEYPLLSRGKVRDIYEIDSNTLLMITTDRMSAFDVIMSKPIPYKGVILNQITLFWMERFKNLIENHLIESDVKYFPDKLKNYSDILEGRSVLVKRAKPLPIECIVRGHITGSGWSDYQKTGQICGHNLPKMLNESDKLEKPIFTPSTKAELGEHDLNITEKEAENSLGKELFEKVKATTLEMFSTAREYAETKGLIIADTKFEFGLLNNKLILIDEVLTPDSSRFWSKKDYVPGKGQASFDKQYLRDWLKTQKWNFTPPPPELPENVIKETQKKYLEAYSMLTGQSINLPN